MQEVLADLRTLGADVLVVSFTKPKLVAAYLERYPLPFPAVSDPDRAAYRAFALTHTTWATFFRPAVLGRYLRLMFGGWKLWKAEKGDDLLQLGGDFVLDAGGRLAWAYPSATPTDRPTKEQVLNAVRAAVK